jgi:hypothetical protein
MHPRDVLFVMPSLSIQMVILPLFFNFVILTLLFEIEAQVHPYCVTRFVPVRCYVHFKNQNLSTIKVHNSCFMSMWKFSKINIYVLCQNLVKYNHKFMRCQQ